MAKRVIATATVGRYKITMTYETSRAYTDGYAYFTTTREDVKGKMEGRVVDREVAESKRTAKQYMEGVMNALAKSQNLKRMGEVWMDQEFYFDSKYP
ncbi:MAG: hypothetical protein MPK62_02080 [Alphaproteobacteria bacterium]|nr:hypothetical protein [Alphaproteobacteria bacterium]MDA8029922.1 hypothetical protein [Alphaproteobacteria bacterium]